MGSYPASSLTRPKHFAGEQAPAPEVTGEGIAVKASQLVLAHSTPLPMNSGSFCNVAGSGGVPSWGHVVDPVGGTGRLHIVGPFPKANE